MQIQDGETGLNVASRLLRTIWLATFALFPRKRLTQAEFGGVIATNSPQLPTQNSYL
jgi:hypothetical protein